MSWDIGSGLADKRVVITGAGGAIGSELARAFAAAGSQVALLDLNADAIARVAATLEGDGHLTVPTNLRTTSSLPALIDDLRHRMNGIDVLVNCAGLVIRRADLRDVTEEDWDAQQDVNLKAAFFLSRAAAEAMREQGRGGRVISFTSQAWWSGSYGNAAVYAAAKGGIVSLMRGMARAYAREKITFNAVAPGAIQSDMLTTGVSDEAMEHMIRQIPMGYVAPPSDMAGAVLFLASNHASYMTGTVLNVSGGWLMY